MARIPVDKVTTSAQPVSMTITPIMIHERITTGASRCSHSRGNEAIASILCNHLRVVKHYTMITFKSDESDGLIIKALVNLTTISS